MRSTAGLRGGARRLAFAALGTRGNAVCISPKDGTSFTPPWQAIAAVTAAGMCASSLTSNRKKQLPASNVKCEAATEKPVSVVAASRDLAEAIEESLAKVQEAEGTDPGERVKCFGPLIGKQQAILAKHGLKSFKDYASKLDLATVEEKKDPEMKRLALAEQNWRSVLAQLEEDANTDLTPKLEVGDASPGFDLLEARSDGYVSLANLLAEGPSCIIMVWLRHFG